MRKKPSYEELQKKVVFLKEELSSLKIRKYNIQNNNHSLFFEISEYSKNGIALFESKDNGKSFIIKYFNYKAAEIENVERDTIIGKNLEKSFPSVKDSGFLDSLKRVFKLNKPEEFPAVVFSSGEIIEWKHNHIYKLSDEEIVSIFVDETENKNKEKELKQHREKLEIALGAAKYFPFEFDLNNLKIIPPKEIYLSLGFNSSESDELLQKSGSLIHPDDFNTIKVLAKNKFLTKPFPDQVEFRIKNKDGNWVWFMATGRVVNWGENKKHGKLFGIVQEIQNKKELLFKLKQSEENFLQLSENISDAFWLRSLENKVIYANNACYKISDGRFNEIFENNDKYAEWIHPDDRERVIKQRKINLKDPNQSHLYEHRIIKPNGEIRWFWIRTFPVYNDSGKLYRRAGIASDVTEQKNLINDLLIAKEKAEESDKLKSSFLANMSHEIRTPMNGILGFAELLKDDDITKKEKDEYLKIVDVNGKQLLSLINDIVDMAKIEARQLSINKTPTKISTLLEETYLLFKGVQNRLNKQDISFSVKFPNKENNIVYTDPARLQQVLNNLLNNAFKFTNSGSISFGYEFVNYENTKYFQFFVSDTGVGISKKMKEFIFERFGQEPNKEYKNYAGTGLGLAISKGLVKLLDGQIWVESTKKNKNPDVDGNSTFYFTLPDVHKARKYENNKPQVMTKLNTLENSNILIVEDDEDNLDFLRRLLVKHGANVLLAKSGEEAIDVVKSNKQINVVLMDIRLPDMDGFETTQKIKEINPNLPIIAQTAYAMFNDKDKCLEKGCDDYVSKPIDKDILFKKIKQYIYK
ncbi:MAG: PAS domain-containing protein [Bacteroidales bacterium]|jgi:two-component system CheB/CheR fusion protein|nr:PAS domain-containing protein [Bacteroidales bacterium]